MKMKRNYEKIKYQAISIKRSGVKRHQNKRGMARCGSSIWAK